MPTSRSLGWCCLHGAEGPFQALALHSLKPLPVPGRIWTFRAVLIGRGKLLRPTWQCHSAVHVLPSSASFTRRLAALPPCSLGGERGAGNLWLVIVK